MEDFNIHGWSAIHEASYKGYTVAVSRFINYAKETQKLHLLDLKTIDDLKATPVLIAALGGHLECMKVLIENGAVITESIKYRNKHNHGLVEIAIIRQDFTVLAYLYENFNETLNVCAKIRNLMTNAENDDEIRASIGRALEVLTSRAHSGLHAKLRDELITNTEFGRYFATFLKQGNKYEESLTSCVLVILNVMHVDEIRKLFVLNKGIAHLIETMDIQKQIINREIDMHAKISADSIEPTMYHELIRNTLEKFDNCNFIIASIGKGFAELTKYSDCLEIINNESYGEKIISFIKLIFDCNTLRKRLLNESSKLLRIQTKANGANNATTATVVPSGILLEQYIHTYLTVAGNLSIVNDRFKKCFNECYLYEYIMNLWFSVQPQPQNNSSTSGNGRNESRLTSAKSTTSTVLTNYYYTEFGASSSKSFKTVNANIADSSTPYRRRSQLSAADKKSKQQLFDYIPPQYADLLDENGKPLISQNLIKILKLAIIECIGKVFYHNFELKTAYMYTSRNSNYSTSTYYSSRTNASNQLNKEKNWLSVTNKFVETLVEFLDPARVIDKEIRIIVLKSLACIMDEDKQAINQIIDYKNADNSPLIYALRTLLLKSCPLATREEAMKLVWVMSGGPDKYFSQTEKLQVYKAIGTQKFVDALCDSEFLSIVALDALKLLSNGPSFREKDSNRNEEKLFKGTEDLSRTHAVPPLVRLLKTKNEQLLIELLRTISSCCVSIGYDNNVQNQITFRRLGLIPILFDICRRYANSNKKVKYEAYLCLSSLVINNPILRNLVYTNINNNLPMLIEALLIMLLDVDSNVTTVDAQLNDIENRATAGAALAGFCYHNDEFKNILVEQFGKIQWKVYVGMLNFLTKHENALKNKANKTLEESNQLIRILKIKCLIAHQCVALYTIIYSVSVRDVFNIDNSNGANEDDDPRATGLKIIIDLIEHSDNSMLRTFAIECLCGLVQTDKTLVEPIISIDTVQILCDQIDSANDEKRNINDIEVSDCSITLAYLSDASAEARRLLSKLTRKMPQIVKLMKYHNRNLNIDLLRQWSHYETLMNMAKKPLIKPPINNRKPTASAIRRASNAPTKVTLKLPKIQT